MELMEMSKEFIKKRLIREGHSHPQLAAPLMAKKIEQRESSDLLKEKIKEIMYYSRLKINAHYVGENDIDQKTLRDRYGGDLEAVKRDVTRLHDEAARGIDSASSYGQLRNVMKTLTKNVVHNIIGKRQVRGRGSKWDEFYDSIAWEIEKGETGFEGIKYDW